MKDKHLKIKLRPVYRIVELFVLENNSQDVSTPYAHYASGGGDFM